MRKFFVVLTAFAFVMAMTLPAMANGDEYEEGMVVPGEITITKAIYVGVKQIVKPSSSAEAHTAKKDYNQANRVFENKEPAVPAGSPEYYQNPITKEYVQIPDSETSEAVEAVPVTKTAVIDDGSLDTASGIINVNQSPGSINNQGNAVSVAYSSEATPEISEIGYLTEGEARFVGGAFLHADADVEKVNGGLCGRELMPIKEDNSESNGILVDEYGLPFMLPLGNMVKADDGTTRKNTISNALGDVTGIVGVNQSAGNINNQNNATSLSVGDGIAALSASDLDLCNTGNFSNETGTTTSDTLTTGALANASGIIGINQSSGCMNNQANVVAASVITFE
jgi:hypothetical protein